MSVTRTAVFIGIMCAAWMASPLTANAVEYQKFVGLDDKGSSTKVKRCPVVDGKGAKQPYSSGTAFGAGLKIDLFDGDGLGHDDNFVAVIRFGPNDEPLFDGVWSKIHEREKNGDIFRETYQLTPSGDLAASPPSGGWEDLLNFINEEARKACKMVAPPAKIYWALSELVKSTLVVSTNPEGQITCPVELGKCSRAWFRLEVKTFMDDGANAAIESRDWGSPKTDSVKFKYEAKGYAVWTDSDATPTAAPTATPTATPTPTPTAVP
jgi:hypothetical protein